jgi:hypothetical protein
MILLPIHKVDRKFAFVCYETIPPDLSKLHQMTPQLALDALG